MITDARVLRDTFIPREIVHRDAEVQELARALEPITEGEDPENVLLHGPTGAGKTCIARHTLERLEEEVLDLRTQYINCWEHYTRFRALYEALSGIGRTLDVHRQSTPKDELLRRLREADDRPYVLILDEADQLEDKKVLYDLHAMPHITMVMIANEEEDVFARADHRVRSRLMSSRRIAFDRYATGDLVAILERRAEHGLKPGAVDSTTLEELASRAGGDARIAITSLRAAARLAEDRGLERITEDVVEEAVPEAREETRQKNVDALNRHQKALYDIIAEKDEIAPRELYDAYQEEVDEPKSERTLRTYLQKMEHYNLVAAEGEKRGRTYRAVTAE